MRRNRDKKASIIPGQGLVWGERLHESGIVRGNAAIQKSAAIRGSATIEMAYIMPLFLWIFFMIVTATFYFHDKCVMYATAYETALVGAQEARREPAYSEAALTEHFQNRIQGKLIFFSDAGASVEKGLEFLTVQAEASKGSWKICVEEKAMIMRTEELIYYSEQRE